MTPGELKSLRLRLGWTQARLAQALGLRHRVQVCQLESGRTAICGPKLVLLEQLRNRIADGGAVDNSHE